ncbi:hypothetical protein HY503_00495 [Candidatus Woesebacteria bacterium]|nr:hypothetical protein [Candidatus Woesebacteria bacterium]
MLTQRDIDELEKTFATKFFLKEELQKLRSDLLDKLDSILKEILAMREEMTIVVHKVSNHEDRITVLETAKTT